VDLVLLVYINPISQYGEIVSKRGESEIHEVILDLSIPPKKVRFQNFIQHIPGHVDPNYVPLVFS
jgi:hypothetical protein